MSFDNNSTDGPSGGAVRLPGPKAKQALALAENIKWMCRTFGEERIGFLTLTVGDVVDGRFVHVQARAEAQRRFNSLLTHVIRGRYRCGVTVSERHKDGGIHFHLLVVCGADIRSGTDFAQCFPRCEHGVYERTPDYSTAPAALRAEWAFWREIAASYGFGRCQMQPVKKNGDAVAHYVGKYIGKAWEHRRPDDKGARLVNYFGNWRRDDACSEKTETHRGGKKIMLGRCRPPWSARHGAMTPAAKAWRECMRQIEISARLQGCIITEDNAKDAMGRHWAWNTTKRMNATVFFVTARCPTMQAHNEDVEKQWHTHARHVSARAVRYWQTIPEDDPEQWRTRRWNRQAKERDEAFSQALASWQCSASHPAASTGNSQRSNASTASAT